MKNTITRKEIAEMLGVSYDTVARREKAWGLILVRSKASRCPYLYFRGRVIHLLTRRGLLAE